jgi:predicted transcriptional regulator of viral defense system
MGEHLKYVKEFISHFSRFPLFSFSSAKLFFSFYGSNEVYAKKFISNMLKDGRLYRITKGYYSFNKSIFVVGLAYKPYYYGLEYALTYHGLWNQQANITVLTTQKVREGVRSAFGINYVLKRIPQRLFFGFRSINVEAKYNVHISDVEKTFLDMVYFDRYIGADTMERLAERMDLQKVSKYAKLYGEDFSEKVASIIKGGRIAMR